MIARIPLPPGASARGGYTVTSPSLPELITEGDTLSGAMASAEYVFVVALDLY